MLTYADVCSLVCVFKAPSSAAYDVGKIRSLEAHININLLDYCKHTLRQHMTKRLVNYLHPAAADATQAVIGGVDLESTCPIPVRSLPVHAKVCQSKMEVAQRHINFGTVMANGEYTKKLFVKNLSDVPLMYRMEKCWRMLTYADVC